jgi:two-component system, OmpR family, phosphate regulon response regulator PhoB
VNQTDPILIVDDEPDIRDLLTLNLQREGFRSEAVGTAAEALTWLGVHKAALIVLDLMLPDMSGTEVCRRIRADARTADIPIIMLTAKGEEIERVEGFQVGADDYVVKSSFSIREFILRIRANLRRSGKPESQDRHSCLTFGGLTIDRAGHSVLEDNREVALTATEFRLLTLLAEREGKVQTRGRLLQDVWELPPGLNTRTVDTHVKRLREKLSTHARCLETVRGVGYRFNAKHAH